MERYALILCRDKIKWGDIQLGWQKEGISVHMVSDMIK